MLSKVVTKNPPFQSYLARHSDLYVRFIRGEIKPSDFSKAEAVLLAEAENVLSKGFDAEVFKATTAQYRDRIAATDRSLVVYSMLCA